MMGTQAAPERLFYDFCLEDHVPDEHLLRRIDLSFPKIPSGLDSHRARRFTHQANALLVRCYACPFRKFHPARFAS